MTTFSALDRLRLGGNDLAALVEESKELASIIPKEPYLTLHSCLCHYNVFGNLVVTIRELAENPSKAVVAGLASECLDLHMRASHLRKRNSALLDSCAAPLVTLFMQLGSRIGAAVHSWKIDGAAALVLAMGRPLSGCDLSDEQADALSNLDGSALALCTTDAQPYQALLDAPAMFADATARGAITFPPALVALSFLCPAIPEVAKVNKNRKNWLEFPTLQDVLASTDGHDVCLILKNISQPSLGPLLKISECVSSTGRFLADPACRGFASLIDNVTTTGFKAWLSLGLMEQAHYALQMFFTTTRSAVAGIRFLLLLHLSLLLELLLCCFASTNCRGGLRDLVMRGVEEMDAIALTINAIAECEQAKGRIHEPDKFSKLVMDVEDGNCLSSIANSLYVAAHELTKFNAAFPIYIQR